MASDPMLDDLRRLVEHIAQRDSLVRGYLPSRADDFIRTHGPALLAKLEAMEKAVAEEREACAAIADEYDGEGHNHGQYTQLGDSVHTQRDIAAAIRARGQS